MISVLRNQYELVKQSRQVLLAYCNTITNADFTQENSSFGRGSIRNLLVHIANVYEYWIGQHGLHRDMAFTSFASQSNTDEVEQLFFRVDALMADFFTILETTQITEITYEKNEQQMKTPPVALFTHVITHEFHHKGQVLSLSRHLGYTPVDTDIIR